MMDNILEKLLSAFQELKYSSMSASDDPKTTMQKYDMPFLGSKFNTIYTNELHHVITEYFQIPIEMEELQKLVPDICSILSMKYKPLWNIDDKSKTIPAFYQVELW